MAPESISLIILFLLVACKPAWRKIYFFSDGKKGIDLETTQRLAFFDFVRGVSLIAVIVIHAIYLFLQTDPGFRETYLFYQLNNLCRFAIPIFLISSGVLLMPWEKVKDKAGFYKRKYFRIFLPYILAVTGIFLVINGGLKDYFVFLLNGRILVPYYFVIVLLQLYILYPWLSRHSQGSFFLPIVFAAGFLFSIFFPGLKFSFGIEPFIPFLFFLAYGMKRRELFISNGEISGKEMGMWRMIIAVFVAVSLMFPDNYYNSQYFYGLAIFNVLYYYRAKIQKHAEKAYSALANFGYYGLWILLLHFLVEKEAFDLLASSGNPKAGQFFLLIISTALITYLLARLADALYFLLLKAFRLEAVKK